MAKKKQIAQQQEHDIIEESNEKLTGFVENIEYFLERYYKIILGVVAGIILLFAGYWAYNTLIKKPKEAKAKDAMIYAQQYFDMDSMQLALNGDGTHLGLTSIIKQYGGTAAGNRAKFCAGIANLKLGKYAEAVKSLEDFSTSDELLNARKFGGIGDAYAEQKQMDKAIDNYKKAADAADNELTAPSYLFRAALALEQKGSKKEALELYKKLFADYPNSQEGSIAEMYIAKLEAK